MTERSGGRWVKGHSGNPAGPQSTDKGRAALREAIRKHIPGVVTKLVELAKDGDVQAARTLLERVLPPIRAEAAAVELPTLAHAKTLTEQGAAVIGAVAAGELAPDVASALLSGIGAQGRMEEIDELRRRMDALERMTNGDA